MIDHNSAPLSIDSPHCGGEQVWCALAVRPRREKGVHAELLSKSISSLLPLRRVRRVWSDRIVTAEEPLFPGYLFVQVNAVEYLRALKTPGVDRALGHGFHPESWITPEQIEPFRRFRDGALTLETVPYLRSGDRVRIAGGPLEGLQGFFVRKGRGFQLVLSIDLLMRSVAVEVDEAFVEPLRCANAAHAPGREIVSI